MIKTIIEWKNKTFGDIEHTMEVEGYFKEENEDLIKALWEIDKGDYENMVINEIFNFNDYKYKVEQCFELIIKGHKEGV